MPSKATVGTALNLQKVNGKVTVTHAHYERIVELNQNAQLTLQCKLYLEQQEKGAFTNAILRGALDDPGVTLNSVLGINMEGLQTQAATQNISLSAAAMDRVMTADQRLTTNAAVDKLDPQYKNVLLGAQLTARANKDDPEAAAKAMAQMLYGLGNTAPVVESCADDNLFENADFIQLQRYKQRMLKEFKIENLEWLATNLEILRREPPCSCHRMEQQQLGQA